jgi:carbonic anhydrase/acetyltransferase-like protein (isoleucine patch superfamily)
MTVKTKPFIHPTAVVLGDVTIGNCSSVWPGAVIRGDFNAIVIGEYTSIQDNVVIHATPQEKTVIGDYVTVGHGAVLHACRIADCVLVGMNATILDGAKIGSNSVIAAGSVIPPGMEVPEGSLVTGVPGKIRESTVDPAIIKQGAYAYYELSVRHKEGIEKFPMDVLLEKMKKYE